MKNGMKAMRDVFIEGVYNCMQNNKSIFFLTADFGSPKLDKLKNDFNDRFSNVGIAEQNLINVSAGLALEGFTVFAYAIAPFITMRAYEQTRNNLSLMSQLKEINVNLIGVGAGLSYDVSGPTHHCLEDLSIMRTLPNITVFSPSDWVLAEGFVDYSIKNKKPKYIRFDSKPLPNIYNSTESINFENGFCELSNGENICIISTGFMTHRAINVINKLKEEGISLGLVDIFILEPFNNDLFFKTINKYKCLISIEEAFINRGGLDSLVSMILENKDSKIIFRRLGFEGKYVFDMGGREYLHKLNNLDEESITKYIKNILKSI